MSKTKNEKISLGKAQKLTSIWAQLIGRCYRKPKNQNLSQLTKRIFDDAINNKLPEIIKEKAERLLNDIFNDLFRSYSDAGKKIKEVIEKKLDINLQEFDMVDYNALIANAVNKELGVLVKTESIEPVLKLTRAATGFMKKKEIKLSEIHELVIETAASDDYKDEKEISFHVTYNEEHGWFTIAIDLDENIEVKNCTIEMLINEKSGIIFIFRTKGKWYGSENRKQPNPSALANYDLLQHKLFRLYSAQVKVIIDETEFENNYEDYDY